MIVLGVAVAGALGAPARYLVERWIGRLRPTAFPFGTFVVNVSGSFLLGIIVGLTLEQGLDADVRTVVGVGFLGAYTTFSTYAYETVRRAEEGARAVAVAYALGSVAVAGVASALGLAAVGAL